MQEKRPLLYGLISTSSGNIITVGNIVSTLFDEQLQFSQKNNN
jgi:hypothetical protein